jgi:hypothetical protein
MCILWPQTQTHCTGGGEKSGCWGNLMIIIKWVFNKMKYIVKQKVRLVVNNYKGSITLTIND